MKAAPRPIIITGPTSVGKTDLAVTLAEKYNGELVNTDKFHTYKGFKTGIGIADSDYKGITKHLYEILPPDVPALTSEDYFDRAKTVFDEICRNKKLPIFEGCSFSYNEKLILNKDYLNSPLIIGLKWENRRLFKDHIVNRVNNLFDVGLVDETEQLLKEGQTDTYVMQKGIIYKYTLEYLHNKLNLNTTKELIIKHFFLAAAYQLGRYKLIKDVHWLNTNDVQIFQKIKRLIDCTE